ncbi:MAG: Zn-dependent M28 family amino/carboxypeptidase [Rhodothermales bacterium]|jgi:Zn-dependent M28 family amino/carboxypeptidase
MKSAKKGPRVCRRLAICLAICLGLLAVFAVAGCAMMAMPGKSYSGPLPLITPDQTAMAKAMQADLHELSVTIGPRNIHDPEKLAESADYIEDAFRSAGYLPQRQTYTVYGVNCANIEVEILGSSSPSEIVIVGGHYDTRPGTVGADDNGTGTVATLALARRFAGSSPARTLRFVAFVNEEPPYFQADTMGSLMYAKRAHERGENIVAMISLECIGYFSDSPDSQAYPAPFSLFYPSTGNFIAFVGNYESRKLVRRVVREFRDNASFPSEGLAAAGALPGIGWSDHWGFWQYDYPALMVTDTAPFRNPNYHRVTDTIDTIQFDKLARIVDGLHPVIASLALVP